MLTNHLRYKDYYAHIAFDPSADAFHGRVIGIQDVIDFYGRTPEELREEFKNSVEGYLTWCAEEGTKPEKTLIGKLTCGSMRIAPSVSRSRRGEWCECQCVDHRPSRSRNPARAPGARGGWMRRLADPDA